MSQMDGDFARRNILGSDGPRLGSVAPGERRMPGGSNPIGDKAVNDYKMSNHVEAAALITSGLFLLGGASTGFYLTLMYNLVVKLTTTTSKCTTPSGPVMPPLTPPKDTKALMTLSFIAHPLLALFGLVAIVLGVGHLRQYKTVQTHHVTPKFIGKREHLRGVILACGVLTGVSAAVPLILGKRLKPAIDQAYTVVAADPVAGAVADLPPHKTLQALWWTQIGFAAAGAVSTGYGIYLLTGEHMTHLAKRFMDMGRSAVARMPSRNSTTAL